MTSRPIAILVFIVAVGGVILLASTFKGCQREPTKEEKKADVVLSEDTTWRRQVAEQDSLIAFLKDSLKTVDQKLVASRDSVRTLLNKDAAEQASLDSTVQAGVPVGKDAAEFWHDQFMAQARIAANLRLQTIPALQGESAIKDEKIRLLEADTTARSQEQRADRARILRLTTTLADLREATKPGVRVLGLRLPSWVDDAAEVGLSLYAGYRIGKAAGN